MYAVDWWSPNFQLQMVHSKLQFYVFFFKRIEKNLDNSFLMDYRRKTAIKKCTQTHYVDLVLFFGQNC